jgi:hypothetical protein
MLQSNFNESVLHTNCFQDITEMQKSPLEHQLKE